MTKFDFTNAMPADDSAANFLTEPVATHNTGGGGGGWLKMIKDDVDLFHPKFDKDAKVGDKRDYHIRILPARTSSYGMCELLFIRRTPKGESSANGSSQVIALDQFPFFSEKDPNRAAEIRGLVGIDAWKDLPHMVWYNKIGKTLGKENRRWMAALPKYVFQVIDREAGDNLPRLWVAPKSIGAQICSLVKNDKIPACGDGKTGDGGHDFKFQYHKKGSEVFSVEYLMPRFAPKPSPLTEDKKASKAIMDWVVANPPLTLLHYPTEDEILAYLGVGEAVEETPAAAPASATPPPDKGAAKLSDMGASKADTPPEAKVTEDDPF